MSHSEPICIASSVGSEIFVEQQCSVENSCGGYQELEQFWGEEKQRLNDADGQKPMANSWEEKLLNDDALVEPSSKGTKEEIKIVKGEAAKDIPTSYIVSGFEPHELIAIGTYVDKNITPGFRYKVRKNHSDDYLFDGKALHLENVGLGYGKRITFQGNSLNDNVNYFWSDSRVHGFGFTLQSLSQNAFAIVDSTGQIGRAVIVNPALSPDNELATVVKGNGRVEKLVRVNFSCDAIMSGGKSNIFMEVLEVQGLALVVRDGASGMAKVEKIVLENFFVDGCCMLPEE